MVLPRNFSSRKAGLYDILEEEVSVYGLANHLSLKNIMFRRAADVHELTHACDFESLFELFDSG